MNKQTQVLIMASCWWILESVIWVALLSGSHVYTSVDELEDPEDGEERHGPVDDSEVKEEENLDKYLGRMISFVCPFCAGIGMVFSARFLHHCDSILLAEGLAPPGTEAPIFFQIVFPFIWGCYFFVVLFLSKQASKQRGRQAGREASKQSSKQAGRRASWQTCKP